jgi:hypothetical protein
MTSKEKVTTIKYSVKANPIDFRFVKYDEFVN